MSWKDIIKEFYYKWEDRVFQWVHENPDDKEQVKNRALLVAVSPVVVGVVLGMIIVIVI